MLGKAKSIGVCNATFKFRAEELAARACDLCSYNTDTNIIYI